METYCYHSICPSVCVYVREVTGPQKPSDPSLQNLGLALHLVALNYCLKLHSNNIIFSELQVYINIYYFDIAI